MLASIYYAPTVYISWCWDTIGVLATTLIVNFQDFGQNGCPESWSGWDLCLHSNLERGHLPALLTTHTAQPPPPSQNPEQRLLCGCHTYHGDPNQCLALPGIPTWDGESLLGSSLERKQQGPEVKEA